MSRKIFHTDENSEHTKRRWPTLLKYFLVFIVIIIAYGVYISAQISSQFEGPKWQIPAQLYARPLSFYPGKDLARTELIKELQLLGYREVKTLNKTGEWRYVRNGIEIYQRSFQFADGDSPEQKIQVLFNRDKVSAVNALDSQQQISEIKLEPLLIDRLVSSELEDRVLVKLDEVPEAMIDALLLIEDRDFYQHAGVKPTAIMRALVTNLKAGRTIQGGSTLTQQLVKNHFLSRERSIVRKINEAIMSLLIELNYSKDEILQAYLNEVYLGQHGNRGIHGFGLASYFYFARPLNELDLHEMALLVGIIKGPSYFNPRRHPERALERRDLVLKLMHEHQLLTQQDYQSWQSKPLTLEDKDRAVKGRHPAFMQLVKRELKDVIDNTELLHAGIRVFTSMDPVAQRNAEKTVVNGLKRLEKYDNVSDLQGAMIVSDIHSAEIKALVGDKNIDFPGFNRVLDMKRPVGSLLKPAVYLTALEDSYYYNLASRIDDKPISFPDKNGNQWQPMNADKEFRGQVSLLDGLVGSLNVPSINLGMEVGLNNIHFTINRLGIEQQLPSYPSMILGAVELSPLKINQAYHTLAGQGTYRPLHSVLAVVDSNNEMIYQSTHEGQSRFDAKATYLVNYALHQVSKQGTAKVLGERFKGTNFAAKTGTTDDYRDSWFSGYDRASVVTAWVGRDDNKPMWLSGTAGALSLFIDYHKSGHPYSLTMPIPDGVEIALFDKESGTHLQAGCTNSTSYPAITANLPEPANCENKNEVKRKRKSWWERIFG